ncbi:unnamed protein product [Fusarium venenatum]|uniref:Uncharacterized protein n=1 Tax=Fusarium venenatum TaxID=56646 RepID=A0A2L2TIA8_9HYPO|nr:uncharacterized protein FVRRES_00659 [Fusarium venenatum]CEI64147.1 unnamed protein product [Fusarium venenatum]
MAISQQPYAVLGYGCRQPSISLSIIEMLFLYSKMNHVVVESSDSVQVIARGDSQFSNFEVQGARVGGEVSARPQRYVLGHCVDSW